MFDEGCSNVSSITGIYINKVQQLRYLSSEQIIRPAKFFVKTVLSRLSLKDKKFELFEPANKEEMKSV